MIRAEPMGDEGVGDLAARRRQELARAFASERAFRVFYDAALPRIYGYLVDRCETDHALAEELTQETFVAAIASHASFDGRADPMTWLTAIARHRLADHFRRLDREEHRRVRALVPELVQRDDSRVWQALDDRASILRTLGGLPAMQRAVLVLHYADGLSVREVAAHIGRSESATESLLTRARETFRRRHEEASR